MIPYSDLRTLAFLDGLYETGEVEVMEKKGTYSPVCVLYRSVNARLVGVVLIQFASLEMNIDFVEAEEMAATHISQSAVGTQVSFLRYLEMSRKLESRLGHTLCEYVAGV